MLQDLNYLYPTCTTAFSIASVIAPYKFRRYHMRSVFFFLGQQLLFGCVKSGRICTVRSTSTYSFALERKIKENKSSNAKKEKVNAECTSVEVALEYTAPTAFYSIHPYLPKRAYPTIFRLAYDDKVHHARFFSSLSTSYSHTHPAPLVPHTLHRLFSSETSFKTLALP